MDFGSAEHSVRRWLSQADVDDGVVESTTTSQQDELVALQRRNRVLEQEVENRRHGDLPGSSPRSAEVVPWPTRRRSCHAFRVRLTPAAFRTPAGTPASRNAV